MFRGNTSPFPLAAAWLFIAGCGSSPEKTPPAEVPPGRTATQTSADTSGAAGLPGPPASTPAPSSADPVERALEDRLFRTDGGRVVLKGIRSHGGWKRWLEVTEVQATIKDLPAKGPDGAAQPPAVCVRPSPDSAIPAGEEERLLSAPFWFANPSLQFEYMGVETAAATGEVLDKVKVFQTTPGSEWWIACFNRHTGILERVLKPAFTREDPLKFRRIDLRGPRQVEGLWFSTLWSTFELESRFSRPDTRRPDRLQEVQVRAVLNAPGPPAPPASD